MLQISHSLRTVRILATVSVFLAASPVIGSTPEDFSCKLGEKFLVSKSEAQQVLFEIFRQAEEDQKASMLGFLAAMPSGFNESVVVEVGSISDLYADHVVVLNANRTGNLYIRIAYERMGDEYFGVQFHAADRLKTVLSQWPFLHEARPLDC